MDWELTTKRILVSEFIDGIKISDVKALKKEGFSLADIDYKLISAFAEQIFHTGFIHADPHPGNVLIRRGKNKSAELVLLDHGLYEKLPTAVRTNLSHLWKAIVLCNHNDMRKYSHELGVHDHQMFAEILTQRPLKFHNFTIKTSLSSDDMEYMSRMAQERFDKVILALRQMPSTLLLVIRNINTIRAITKDHGDPIDRYTIMARSATKGAFAGQGFVGSLKGLKDRMYFEVRLWSDWFKLRLLHYYVRILQGFGKGNLGTVLKYVH